MQVSHSFIFWPEPCFHSLRMDYMNEIRIFPQLPLHMSGSHLAHLLVTPYGLAQLVEHQATMWQVESSKPRLDQHSGSFYNYKENAAFVMTSANGQTFQTSRIRTIKRRFILGCKRAHTLFAKSRAWRSQCCGLCSVIYHGLREQMLRNTS